MNRNVLMITLGLLFLLSSNIFALPISYSSGYKGQSSSSNLGQAGFSSYSITQIADRQLRPAISLSYLTDGDDVIGATTDPSGTGDGGKGESVPAIPEPTTLILLGLGLTGMAIRKRKR